MTAGVQTDFAYALEIAKKRGPLAASMKKLLPALERDESLSLDRALPPQPSGEWPIPIGRIDRPSRQEQVELEVDPRPGAILFTGGIAAGKTYALATTAASFLYNFTNSICISVSAAAGELESLLARHEVNLSHKVNSSSAAEITLLIDQLAVEVIQRARVPSDASILVIIDDVDNMISTVASYRAEPWYRELIKIVNLGRQRGVYFALSARQPSAIPIELRSVCNSPISLGSDSENLKASARPGVGIGHTREGDELQIYNPVTRRSLSSAHFKYPLYSSELARVHVDRDRPVRIENDSIYVPLGVDEIRGENVDVELGWRSLLIVGPPRSGKTTTLVTIADALNQADWTEIGRGFKPLQIFGRRRGDAPSGDVQTIPTEHISDIIKGYSLGSEQIDRLFVDEVINGVVQDDTLRISPDGRERYILLVDDLHVAVRDSAIRSFLERAFRLERVCLVMTSEIGAVKNYEWTDLKEHSNQALFLRPTWTTENNVGSRVLNDSLLERPGSTFAPGQGILYSQQTQTALRVYAPKGTTPSPPDGSVDVGRSH